MNNQDGKIWVGYGVDTSGLKKGEQEASGSFEKIAVTAKKSGDSIDEAFKPKSITELIAESKILDGSIKDNNKEIKEMAAQLKELEAAKKGATGNEFFKADYGIKELQEKIAATKDSTQALQDEKRELDRLIDGQKSFEKATAEANKEAKNQETAIVKLLGGQEKYNSILNALPAPLKSAVSGIASMTKAAIAFIATPLGAIIAAIVVGLKALHTWFNSSAEGQMALTKATGYLSGVLGQLKEIVISVGKFIYDAFNNPKQAVSDLWEAIKTNLMNRLQSVADGFKAIGKIAGAAFDLDWEGVKQGAADFGSAILKLNTGVDDLAGKTANWVKGMDDAGKKTQALNVAEEQLRRDREQWSLKEQELENKAQELYSKSYSAKTDQERAKYLKEYQAIQDQIFDKRVEFQKEEVRIQDEINKITTNDNQANTDLIEKQKTLLALERERTQSKQRAERMLGSIGRKDIGGDISEQQRLQQEFDKLYISAIKKRNDTEIQLERSKITDAAALRKFDFDQKIQQIKDEQAALEAAAPKGTTVDTTIVTKRIETETKLFETSEAEITAKENEAILKQYATFSEKYIAKVKELQKAKEDILKAGGTTEQQAVAEEQFNADMAALDAQFYKNTEGFETFAKSIVDNSVEQLTLLLTELEVQLAESTQGVENESNAALRAQISILKEQLKTAKPESDKKGANDIKRWQATQKVLSDVVQTTNQVIDGFEGISEETKNILKATTTVAAGTISLISGITEFGQFAVKSTEMAAQGVAASIIALEKASIILTIVSAAVQIATTIANIFTSARKKQEEAQRKIEENNRKALLGEMELTAEYRRRYEWAKKIGETELASIKRRAEELKKQNAANQADQKRLMGLLAKEQYVASESFQKTGLFGWGKGKIVQDMRSLANVKYEDIERLSAQGKLTESAEQYFQALKKAKEEGKDLAQMQTDFAEEQREFFTGSSFESVVEKAMNLLRSGVKDAGETFNDLMIAAVNSAMTDLASGELRDWYERFAKAGEDGYTIDEIERFQKEWQNINNKLSQKADELQRVTGVDIRERQQQGSASAKAIQNITTEQANQIDGKLTALQVTNYEMLDTQISIKDNVIAMSSNVGFVRESVDELRVLTRKMSEDVAMIRTYSSELPEMAKTLKNVEFNTSKL